MTQILNEYLFNTQHQSSHLFSVLSVEERSELTDTAVTRLIRKGHSIFEEGQQPQGLVFLAKGSAKVYKVGTGVREQIVRLVRPQSFVGYKALFAEKAHTTTAEAMDASEIIVYNKEVLFRIMDVNPAFSRRIIRALANELSFNYSRLIT